jgi:hypothetical protein
MPNATVRANARALPETTELTAVEREDFAHQEAFSRAYVRWLGACAC